MYLLRLLKKAFAGIDKKKTMKIGILTLPFNNNYGGYLQAFALLTVLKQQGHDVEIIYRRPRRRPFIWIVKTTFKNIVKVLLGRKVWCIIPDQEKDLRAKGAKMMPFVDKYVSPRSKPLYSSKALAKYASNRYDAIVVGSDQVWRPDYVSNIEDFFLVWLDNNTLKLSYAASFGTNDPKYSDEKKKTCGDALQYFKAVSVREKDAVEVIEKLGWDLKCKPQQVLDPTMLLEKEVYKQHICKVKISNRRKVFCYVLDQSSFVHDIISETCNTIGCEAYQLGVKCDGNFASIEEWLRAINEAEVVITDSYHGTVFSIILNKPFIVCMNAERGLSRFVSLLSIFKLNHRIVKSKEDVRVLLNENIDWERINCILAEERVKSTAFLKENLQ